MDVLERFQSMQQALRTAMEGNQAMLWTAMPGIIGSFDPKAVTATVQVATRLVFTGPDHTQKQITIPPLPDVPIIFMHGGSYAQTFPVKTGDECLVVFASRCIDNWWSQGGVQVPADNRMHDLSDGFALVGPWSQASLIQNVSTTTAQFRTVDGTIAITLDAPNQKVTVANGGLSVLLDANAGKIIVAGGPIELDGSVTVKGNLQVNGNINATGTITP